MNKKILIYNYKRLFGRIALVVILIYLVTKYICNDLFNGNILNVRKTNCRKTIFVQKLGIN